VHELPLITTIAAAFTAAWALGLLTQKLGLSPIVGYLVAGILIGPSTPGFKGDVDLARQLAEVGVILLMFGVGLHFHLKDLLAVKAVAIPGALGQSLVATLVAVVIFSAMGEPVKTGVVLGFAMAVASTVVLMRVLMDADALDTSRGHIAVGWLLVEDILTVILLVLIPVLGTTAIVDAATDGAIAAPSLWIPLGYTLLKLALLVGIFVFAGSWAIPWVLVRVARLRSRELFTLTILVFSIAIAAGSYTFFGASMALGAFLAGMVVAQSPLSHQAAADALPMRDAFAVLFFVSVGMLFDPGFVLDEPLMIVAALGIILVVKPLTALVIVAVLGYPAQTALTVAIGLAQIGEFSFIVSELAREHGLMSDAGQNAIVAAAIVSITLNPLLFRSLKPMENWLQRRPMLWNLINGRSERAARKMNLSSRRKVRDYVADNERLAIVVGFGPIGRTVHQILTDANIATVVIDLNVDTIAELQKRGHTAIFGDASREGILEQAGVRHASHVIATLPDVADRLAVVTAVRSANEHARLLVRARYLTEREDLESAGATAAVFEEVEAALALARLVLADTGASRNVADEKLRDLRMQLLVENMSNLQTQRVASAMVPWPQVFHLSTADVRSDVLQRISKHNFSRWPVIDATSGRPMGYVLANDLIAEATSDKDWQSLIRPMPSIDASADVASTLISMQSDGVTIALVEEAGVPLGLLTREGIMERVIGRIEGERGPTPPATLAAAIADGGVILELKGRTRDQVVQELAAAVPATRVPRGTDVAALALAREEELSSDLGVGIAVPHARCRGLPSPVVVVGRSKEGVPFSRKPSRTSQDQSAEPVRLVFLLVTPAEDPQVQLSLLGQLARIAGDEQVRDALRRATTTEEVRALFAKPYERAPKTGDAKQARD